MLRRDAQDVHVCVCQAHNCARKRARLHKRKCARARGRARVRGSARARGQEDAHAHENAHELARQRTRPIGGVLASPFGAAATTAAARNAAQAESCVGEGCGISTVSGEEAHEKGRENDFLVSSEFSSPRFSPTLLFERTVVQKEA